MSRSTQVDVPVAGGRTMRATLVLPDGEVPAGGWPGVLVVHEAFGLTPEITAVGAMFADRGWVAVVPDVVSAGSKVGCLLRTAREMVARRPGPVVDDLVSVQQWLAARDDVAPDRTTAIGFCMGGQFALLLGTLAPDGLAAVSANYGQPPADDVDLTRCPPVIAGYGERDRFLAGAGPALEARLAAAGVEHEVHTYPGAAHSFLTGDHRLLGFVPLPGTRYTASAAEDAWPRIFAFLERHTSPEG
ncbi:carboxymethylenebutenolidase [Klenkia soli]|uniref:Carboxymethylenebutenolidase n=1 Tax=Klenkia soli TaxID=1052260 RepID=A0A1H0U8F1_9ACTN|nr:dienelactone hydrolase family protein [Klenkia soli]SDP62106.1 carboxymethylenebutenolidase [Klenkia soli]